MTSGSRMSRRIGAAFVLSGAAGLVYEALWSRYLGLFVGHGAYAQTLVLSVYLGGMALGAFVVADRAGRVRRPLLRYAQAEIALALFGLLFHLFFLFATHVSYEVLFPALADGRIVSSLRWVVAGLLILPQSMVLGATFPLMAAALVRADPVRPGRMIARAYLLNTLGGAAGVLIGGFVFVRFLGLPGTSVAAAGLNLCAAAFAWSVSRSLSRQRTQEDGVGEITASAEMESAEAPPADAGPDSPSPSPSPIVVLLFVSAGTAAASFAYEIGWIRMLSLVLGSATHSFELMLSAFILGLGLGAWLIHGKADRAEHPIRLLGWIQVAMGCAALLSLPIFYWVSFDAVASLIQRLPGTAAGYFWFNVARYGLCLVVMLPASILAGTTLPLITTAILKSDDDEAAIGRVYGFNTIGSVLGAAAAGLFFLPMLGLKGLVVAGAALDALLGVFLLTWPAGGRRPAWRLGLMVAGGGTILFVGVAGGLQMDPSLLSSGVYRHGSVPGTDEFLNLFHSDGRTATVSAYVGRGDGVVVLSTNGKPDASLGPRWLSERRDTLTDEPIPRGRDYTTQVLAPMVSLAHRPDARSVANIGHGSGITGTAFLTRAELERVVTIEIEPVMVQGSLVFLPMNGPSLADPRSSFVFDDAKAYFAYQRELFDIIFAEPSNPWVSGTASLFTKEFYRNVSGFLTEAGVFAQWMQVYELTDDLFLSVLAALDETFPSYRAYLVGDADVAIVASLQPLAEADWSILESESFAALTDGIPAVRAEHMESLVLFDETTFRALLDQPTVPSNSDFRPLLDLGAERARFEGRSADGVYSFGSSRVDLARVLAGRPQSPLDYHLPPAYGLVPAIVWGRSSWIREALAEGGGIAPPEFPEWQDALLDLRDFQDGLAANSPPLSWEGWSAQFGRVEASIHWGTVAWTDSTFYEAVFDFLDAHEAPDEARASVGLLHAATDDDWAAAVDFALELIPSVSDGRAWLPADVLLDWTVVAAVRARAPSVGRAALSALTHATGRADGDLRMALLDALLAEVEAAGSSS